MNQTNINMIVVAEDDDDDKMLISEAFEENNIACPLMFVSDGIELLDLLNKKGKYSQQTQMPDLIFLDINMPKKNGKQVLKEIKENPITCHIPIIMFSTSSAMDEINMTYRLGANSFIVKPSSYSGFIEVFKHVQDYWLNTVSFRKVVKY
jgi:two-component system, response regulator